MATGQSNNWALNDMSNPYTGQETGRIYPCNLGKELILKFPGIYPDGPTPEEVQWVQHQKHCNNKWNDVEICSTKIKSIMINPQLIQIL